MQVYLVGGAVRDQLLGLPVKDKDWVVVGATEKQMYARGFKKVGKDFPVFLHPKTREEYALARVEKKTAKGYQGFKFDTNPDITLYQDLKRRDLTINAMALDEDQKLYDPFQGKEDIKRKKLRHVSDAFAEDPLRVLRVARFKAKFHYLGFEIAKDTIRLMEKIIKAGELEHLSAERIYLEIQKALQTQDPDVFFITLHQLGVFKHILCEFEQLMKAGNQVFKPLNFAKTKGNQDNYILFSLIAYQLDHAENIQNIAKNLALPSALKRLILDVHQYHQKINHLKDNNAKSILALLKKTNALRHRQHIDRIITCCAFIGQSSPQQNTHQTDLLVKMLNDLSNYDYSALINKATSQSQIASSIEKKRLEIIQNHLSVS
ncbi:multifunctional CCA tRNA nucleotidyl transferase/2'3'-cyclic phosphodiesterase/2'nucleotidase/phosphatase [Facilibium subflavum]|uniref:multifunctional CCA tRNA nucleotidyl transferase/2'3'-cyclic phosphodiesterase/2'nucleotidase/phosphatase n=1 Tax=Facilibium subflavum TaxID=2219058 RepID=UPI000E6493B4|nr:multifunctional CCA tRNA nucleotidyl transferase/2'3'-cyclic phosphodiesterase/2'nucleotidase/phosphatase [Facilibium subflavum]